MITSAFRRYFNSDYKKHPIIGNLQYKPAPSSPALLAATSPFVGTVDHRKIFDFYKSLEEQEKKEAKKVKCIYLELSKNKNHWVKVSTSL